MSAEHVWLSGRIVPAHEAVVSVFDRSFLYGDGLFETIRWSNGKPFRWNAHLDRLVSAAAVLGIQSPFSPEELTSAATALAVRNKLAEGVVRLHLTRGIGLRGYSPSGANSPAVVITTHADSKGAENGMRRWSLKTSPYRVPAADPLTGFKTANKLLQIAARADAEAGGFNDALILNADGFVAESSTGNIFWIEAGVLHTPALKTGALPGVTRAAVIELARSSGIRVNETLATGEQLKSAAGAFLTMSGLGLVEIVRLDETPIPSSPHTSALLEAYRQMLAAETA
jgi:branched-chain amino acid aminotransferase